MASLQIDKILDTHNLVAFKSPLHSTQAQLDNKSGEWQVWVDGKPKNSYISKDHAVSEACRLCAAE